MLLTEGNAHFLSGALGTLGKFQCLEAKLASTVTEERTTGSPHVDKKREKNYSEILFRKHDPSQLSCDASKNRPVFVVMEITTNCFA